MKLMTDDGNELMEVSAVRTDKDNLVVCGTIMGAMPIEAIVTPAQLRQGLKLVNFKLICTVICMLFKK